MSLEENHEESETNEDHHVDIHEHAVEGCEHNSNFCITLCDYIWIGSMCSHFTLEGAAEAEDEDHDQLCDQE